MHNFQLKNSKMNTCHLKKRWFLNEKNSCWRKPSDTKSSHMGRSEQIICICCFQLHQNRCYKEKAYGNLCLKRKNKCLSLEDKWRQTILYLTKGRSRKKFEKFEQTTPFKKKKDGGFPGDAVVENLPANAGHTGLSPGLGRSHMPRSN